MYIAKNKKLWYNSNKRKKSAVKNDGGQLRFVPKKIPHRKFTRIAGGSAAVLFPVIAIVYTDRCRKSGIY